MKGFKIENFRGIKSLEVENLPHNASWIFLTGENGFGKTSFLQGLAIALYGSDEETYKFVESDFSSKIELHNNQEDRALSFTSRNGYRKSRVHPVYRFRKL